MEDRLDQIDWDLTLRALGENVDPMSWNLVLAFIPLILSYLLFNPPRSIVLRSVPWLLLVIAIGGCYSRFQPLILGFGSHLGRVGICLSILGIILGLAWISQEIKLLIWGSGALVFILFLPNAAYVLTDLIHLVFDIRKGYPVGTVVVFLIPQYVLFVLAGFESYVISIMNVGDFLARRGWRSLVLPMEILLHGCSALGIYLGRFLRLNSWDLWTDPDRLLHTLEPILLSRHALTTIGVTFGILWGLFGILKPITLGLIQLRDRSLYRSDPETG